MTTFRTQYEGRTYDVVTDEALKNEPLCIYCQVYRVRQDGSRGRKIVTTMLIFHILKSVQGR